MANSIENVPESNSSAGAKQGNSVPDWILAKEGIKLIINNNSTDAKTLFLQHPDSLIIFSGYSFAVFMDALTSLEEDKINLAVSTLKEVEKRCVVESGWFKNVIPMVFGMSESTPQKPICEQLETQIILADSQLCMSILIFLQQDFSGYFRASWLLRKAWKVYQKVHKEILALYTETIGQLHLPDPSTIVPSSSITQTQSQINSEWDVPDTSSTFNGYIPSSRIPHSKSDISCETSNETEFACLVSSKGSKTESKSLNNHHSSYMKRSTSTNSSFTSRPNKESLWNSKFSLFHTSLSLHNFSLPLKIFSSQDTVKNEKMDKQVIERLMGAVSFGFGLFQLGISLLPPSLLKLTNILGFAANRENGISCLMYARLGEDMRAPLATLALLWYHTIVRPFYAIDGNNVQAGVDSARMLLEESEAEFGESTMFLFFGGRVSRLNSDIKSALRYFQQAAENANQREMKLLSLHEVGWCHLIELNYYAAEGIFSYLNTSSRWSRCFYAYLACVCAGACQNSEKYNLFDNFSKCSYNITGTNQLDEFLNRRRKYCPINVAEITSKAAIYWKLLILEMLYLWNALPSCSADNFNKIIKKCVAISDFSNDEPMVGLSKLILGCSYCVTGQVENAIVNYRECLRMRRNLAPNAEDAHISAFAQYELGTLLLKNTRTKNEGILLLQQMNHYSKYDFEQRLNVRVHALLKSTT